MITDMDIELKTYTIIGVINNNIVMDTFYAKSKRQAIYFFWQKYGYNYKILKAI